MHRKDTNQSQTVILMDGLTSWVYEVLLYGHITFKRATDSFSRMLSDISFQFLTSVKMKLRFAYSNLTLGIFKSLQSFVPCFEIWEISMSSGKPHFSGEVIGDKKMQWLLS